MVKHALAEEPMVILIVSKRTTYYTHIPNITKLKPYQVCKTTEYFDLQICFKVDVASYSLTASPSNIFIHLYSNRLCRITPADMIAQMP